MYYIDWFVNIEGRSLNGPFLEDVILQPVHSSHRKCHLYKWWCFKPMWMDMRQDWRTGVEWREKICLAWINNGFPLQCSMGTLNSWPNSLLSTNPASLPEREKPPYSFSNIIMPRYSKWKLLAGLWLYPLCLYLSIFLVWRPTVSWLHISQHYYHCPLTASHHLPPLWSPWLYHLLLQYFFHSRLANYAMSLPYLKIITACRIKHK